MEGGNILDEKWFRKPPILGVKGVRENEKKKEEAEGLLVGRRRGAVFLGGGRGRRPVR